MRSNEYEKTLGQKDNYPNKIIQGPNFTCPPAPWHQRSKLYLPLSYLVIRNQNLLMLKGLKGQ